MSCRPISRYRCVYYLPRSVSEILCHPTYSAEKGKLPFRARRQLDQAKERRGQMEATEIKAIELEAEDGIATKKGGMLYGVESDTVDVVGKTERGAERCLREIIPGVTQPI